MAVLQSLGLPCAKSQSTGSKEYMFNMLYKKHLHYGRCHSTEGKKVIIHSMCLINPHALLYLLQGFACLPLHYILEGCGFEFYLALSPKDAFSNFTVNGDRFYRVEQINLL